MTPTTPRDEFIDTTTGYDEPIVTHVETPLDVTSTPLHAYAALTGRTTNTHPAAYSFLLESAEKIASSDPNGAFAPTPHDRHARFSFVGHNPDAVITIEPTDPTVTVLRDTPAASLVSLDTGDTLDLLRSALPDVTLVGFPDSDRQQLTGGLVGFLAYEAVYDLWLEDIGVPHPDSRFPDAQFVLTTETLVFDHATDSISVVCTPVLRPSDDPAHVYDDLKTTIESITTTLESAPDPQPGGFTQHDETAGSQEAYEDAVRNAKEHVLDGNIYQGVISRTRELTGDIDPLGLYAALRDINPSPYMYVLGYDDLSIVGASPETLLSVRGTEIVGNPIAGTCERGTSPVEDRRLAGEMLADDKERAEHTMLVDLARNDLRRVSEPSTVQVQEFMNVLKYSHVQHIESTVTGQLTPDNDAFDATRATFPAGTLTGAPKIRAMEIIHDLEQSARGPYGGGIGYYSWNGDADFAIVIRTATIEHDDPARITVQAGGGIVADSQPACEYQETENKMGGVLVALEEIETSHQEVTRQ